MTLNATRFGNIEYTQDDVVTFDEGLIGFSQCKEYVLLHHKPDSPFRWLQSVDEARLAFLVTDPGHFVQEYSPAIDESMVEGLDIVEDTPRFVLTTANIPAGKPNDMTLNLAAPIVINAITRKAKQLVLEDHAYTIKHRVFPAADRSSNSIAA